MKYKTTRKAIVNGTPNACLVSAGYCDLQSLLMYHSPSAYACGVYGWNFDVYDVNGLTICTGYRGMPGRRAKGIAAYEEKARRIRDTVQYPQCREQIEQLLCDFCKMNMEG